ncbi:MAG: hypothetical protein H6745_26585 [Deltaproteobacteria bacterium]|nr:hypothetical protein [Deltaproteobacteria bacterium]
MTRRTTIDLGALALLLGAAALFIGAAPAPAPPPDAPARRPGEPEAPARPLAPRGPTTAKNGGDASGSGGDARGPAAGDDGGSPGGAEDRRRPLEAPRGGGGAPEPNDKMLLIPITSPSGCPLPNHPRVVERLLGLENRSQLLSLELWGDTDAYVPFQKVLYYLRAPRPMYVTLFWIGPRGDVFIPFQSLKIPAQRDVQVDPASIVVPPLGHERWVAVATLEPTTLPCGAPEPWVLAALEKMLALPHAVGRWEVVSKP